MTKREAAERLFALLQRWPLDRKPIGYPQPLTVEALELTLERKHYLLGEDSLKSHPFYPPGLKAGWLRETSEREAKYIATQQAKAEEMARRQAELDAGKK